LRAGTRSRALARKGVARRAAGIHRRPQLGGGYAGGHGRHPDVSTRCDEQARPEGARPPSLARGRGLDPAEEVALVARAKRELLLRVNRRQLRREDLEDCFSQATLELVAHVRKGGVFASRLHLANLLELRFTSRVRDRRRALSGRSPMQAALGEAISFGALGEESEAIADRRAEVETLVMLRHDLRRVQRLAGELTADQRLVLAAQVGQSSCADFCSHFGWSPDKYRKVAQRARMRLRELMEQEE
jgi:DNA-directed RNA polymerase specialized sigma24 family protein